MNQVKSSTPAQKAGLVIGQQYLFERPNKHHKLNNGDVVEFVQDDHSMAVFFQTASGQQACAFLDSIHPAPPIAAGELLKITENTSGHRFELGTVVKHLHTDGAYGFYYCMGEDGATWWLRSTDCRRTNIYARNTVEATETKLEETTMQALHDWKVGDFGIILQDCTEDFYYAYPKGTPVECVGQWGIYPAFKALVGDYSQQQIPQVRVAYVQDRRALELFTGARLTLHPVATAPEREQTPAERMGLAVGDTVYIKHCTRGSGFADGECVTLVEDDGSTMLHFVNGARGAFVLLEEITLEEPYHARTPAERAGWAVGDYGITVIEHMGLPKGTPVRFTRDDGSDCPRFDFLDGHDYNYMYLANVVHVSATEARAALPKPKTQLEQAGMQVGTVCYLTQEYCGLVVGTVVQIVLDDGTDRPLVKVLVHPCRTRLGVTRYPKMECLVPTGLVLDVKLDVTQK